MKYKSLGLISRSKDIPEKLKEVIERKIKYGDIKRTTKVNSLKEAAGRMYREGNEYLSHIEDNMYLFEMNNHLPSFRSSNPFKYPS